MHEATRQAMGPMQVRSWWHWPYRNWLQQLCQLAQLMQLHEQPAQPGLQNGLLVHPHWLHRGWQST